MSVWTTLEGTIQIPKSKHVSIPKVIEYVFTDEYSCNAERSETFVRGKKCYSYLIDISIRIDGEFRFE